MEGSVGQRGDAMRRYWRGGGGGTIRTLAQMTIEIH